MGTVISGSLGVIVSPKQNVIKERPLKECIPNSTIELIESTNLLDIELYRFARSEFTRLVEQQDQSFQEEIDKFKKYNELMQRFSNYPGGRLAITFWDIYMKSTALLHKS
jgi:hypothetical protein